MKRISANPAAIARLWPHISGKIPRTAPNPGELTPVGHCGHPGKPSVINDPSARLWSAPGTLARYGDDRRVVRLEGPHETHRPRCRQISPAPARPAGRALRLARAGTSGARSRPARGARRPRPHHHRRHQDRRVADGRLAEARPDRLLRHRLRGRRPRGGAGTRHPRHARRRHQLDGGGRIRVWPGHRHRARHDPRRPLRARRPLARRHHRAHGHHAGAGRPTPRHLRPGLDRRQGRHARRRLRDARSATTTGVCGPTSPTPTTRR